jgi:hypothetical protein
MSLWRFHHGNLINTSVGTVFPHLFLAVLRSAWILALLPSTFCGQSKSRISFSKAIWLFPLLTEAVLFSRATTAIFHRTFQLSRVNLRHAVTPLNGLLRVGCASHRKWESSGKLYSDLWEKRALGMRHKTRTTDVPEATSEICGSACIDVCAVCPCFLSSTRRVAQLTGCRGNCWGNFETRGKACLLSEKRRPALGIKGRILLHGRMQGPSVVLSETTEIALS